MNNHTISGSIGNGLKDRKKILGLIHLALVIGLLVLIFMVMRLFIVPLIWSVILVILLLPLYRIFEVRLSGRHHLAALILIGMFALFFILAIVPLIWLLVRELLSVFKSIEGEGRGLSVEWLRKIESLPFIGSQLAPYLLDEMNDGYAGIIKTLKNYNSQWLSLATKAMTDVAGLIFGGSISILSLYFLLVNISTLVAQIRNGARALGGSAYLSLLESVYLTVRATLQGVLLTALAQGLLAGLAYFISGVQFPLLLTILTAFASLLPFGPPFVYVPVALMMAGSGYTWISVTLFLMWCVGVISVVDNLLKPFFISQATSLSFLLVLFGIIGGIASFGLVGIFIGPVVMTLAMHLWGELVKKAEFEVA
jgi:predicted PurR-regulated permease PerM